MNKYKEKTTDINIYEVYLNDIRKYGPINNEQIRNYLKLYKKNGNSAERDVIKERLVGSLQRFVLSIAKKYSRNHNIMDIIGEGNIGLLNAIENYDIESCVKFTTYATYWVRKEIMLYLTLKEPMVIPPNAVKLATYLPKVRQELLIKNNRVPTTEDIQETLCEKYNLNISKKTDIHQYQQMSIDDRYERDDDRQEVMKNTLYNVVTGVCNTDELIKRNDERVIIDKILSNVNERDAYIIKCVYGIDCEAQTMENVAEKVGVGYERVRQIVTNNVSKLGVKHKQLIGSF